MEGGAKEQKNNKPLDVFKDFKGRHAALIKALTTDVEEFFKQCDPEKENLCLYGLPNEQWAVNLPAEDLPLGLPLPEPVLGINFARDGMEQKDWLSFVAYHSDAWLLAVAFYAGARFGKADRKRLFDMINDLPTIHEVVTGVPKTQQKEKFTVSYQSINKYKPNTRKRASEQKKYEEEVDEEGWDIEKDDEEEQGETFCGSCGEKYEEDEFWICCDNCETWFHGQCVKITAATAEYMKKYKCPPCSSKRHRS